MQKRKQKGIECLRIAAYKCIYKLQKKQRQIQIDHKMEKRLSLTLGCCCCWRQMDFCKSWMLWAGFNHTYFKTSKCFFSDVREFRFIKRKKRTKRPNMGEYFQYFQRYTNIAINVFIKERKKSKHICKTVWGSLSVSNSSNICLCRKWKHQRRLSCGLSGHRPGRTNSLLLVLLGSNAP